MEDMGMNELQVVVQQTPGTVTWNYEDLKKAITNALEVYKTTEYDDSNIGQAKKDRAMLNNLSKSVNARKIEIKKKCLEPYELIETQAKELMAIIQEPIAVIDERLTEYETARRKKARAVILEYMQKAFEGIEQQIADKAKNALYDDRWENATAKKSEWQTAIDARADAIRSDLQVLAGIEEKFRSYAMDAYRPNLKLADAMQKVQELRAQEAAILKRQQEEAAQTSGYPERPQSDIGRTIDNIEREAFARATASTPIQEPIVELAPKPVQDPEIPFDPKPSQTIRITGSPEDYQKVIEYIKAMGIDYEEV
nr:MAG: Protein of unknown function (DUF1351) [Bacteriophage sp.]